MSAIDIIDRYGVPAALLIIVVLGLLPVIRDKLIPAWIQLLTTDIEFRRQIEVQRLESARATNTSIQALATAMSQTNERIAIILDNQNKIQERENMIIETLTEGMAAMRETVARREGYTKGKQEHKKGDTGPLQDEA
jgi:hypothetical protein